jgi:hypothetical protein
VPIDLAPTTNSSTMQARAARGRPGLQTLRAYLLARPTNHVGKPPLGPNATLEGHIPWSEVPPAGLEPAAYRLGGRASVALFALVSAQVRDYDSSSSRIRPALGTVA